MMRKTKNNVLRKKSNEIVKGPFRVNVKIKKNVIDPELMIKNYGADAVDYLFYQTAQEKDTVV